MRVGPDPLWRTAGCIDIEEARLACIEARGAAAAEGDPRSQDRWRRDRDRRLASIDARLDAEPDIHLVVARRGLEASLGDPLSNTRSASAPPAMTLQIPGRRLRWLGREIDLRRSPVLWRLLVALAQEASDRPGATVSPDALIEAVWAGQRMSPSSARNRLHVAIANVRRRLGPDLIEWVEEGYRLAVPAAMRFESERDAGRAD